MNTSTTSPPASSGDPPPLTAELPRPPGQAVPTPEDPLFKPPDASSIPSSGQSSPASATATATPVTTVSVAPLSKSQLKKLRRAEHFAATREEWKAKKREKRKERKAAKREATRSSASAGTKRKSLENEGGEADGRTKPPAARKPKQHNAVEDITLVLDCGFDELMTDKEVVSMSSQLTRCYSTNRKAKKRFKVEVTSLNKRLAKRFETLLSNQHRRWKDVKISSEEYDVTDKDKTEEGDLVYLTADSPHTLQELERGKRYIIGGIVDRNRHKNLCFNKAQEQRIKTARLPIGDYIKMASRQVLATNHVVEIMLHWLESKDWEDAFIKVIPKRKGPKTKIQPNRGEHEEGEEDEEQQEGLEAGSDEGVADVTDADGAAESPRTPSVTGNATTD